jgi:glyoxylase-like metal-dependent hydrolase (beta-lactamase superfamily II)
LEQRIALQTAHMEATKEITPMPPDTTFNERMSLFRGDREIQVHFFGRAHTGGDVVVYLPADKIAYTGDMALEGPSWLGDGHVDEWPDTLEGLKGLDLEMIVPGHGNAFTDLKRIDYVQAYYRDLWAQVVSLRAEGKSAGEAAGAVDLTNHEETLGISRVGTDPTAVARIYQLLDERGE